MQQVDNAHEIDMNKYYIIKFIVSIIFVIAKISKEF